MRSGQVREASQREADREYLPVRLAYYHDKTTGLCFAAHNLSYNNAVLTYVPCSDAVMARCAFIGTAARPVLDP